MSNAKHFRNWKQRNYEFAVWYRRNWNRWNRNNPKYPVDPKFLEIHTKRGTPPKHRIKVREGYCQKCESKLKEGETVMCGWCVRRTNAKKQM